MLSSRCMPRGFAVVVLAILSACDRDAGGDALQDPVQFATRGRALISCPVAAAHEFSQAAGPEGARLSGGGVEIDVPAGALEEPVVFRVHVPASPYIEVDISVEGHEHYRFVRPITVTLDYSRCSNGPPPALSVWYIEDRTRALLENMGGVDDRPNRRITFSTVHLSGYAIAN